jgi:hypothetical protein
MNLHYKYNEKIHQLEQKAFQLEQESWFKFELLSWQWWILLAFLILPWMIWAKLVKREKLLPIVLFGTLTCIITVFLDVVGMKYEFWHYPYQLVPLTPRAISFDMSMVPVGYMLIYQYFSTWKSFLFAQVVMAALFAFIGEPFSIWADLVIYKRWNIFYSFIFYIVGGLFVRWLVEKMINNYNKN